MKPFLGVMVFTCWSVAAITPASAEGDLPAIGRMLERSPLICADFTQTKSLRALQRPLISKGRVVFAAEKGVLWQVREPFPTQVLIKQDALIRWNEAGEPQRLGFAQSPIFSALARVFLAVFNGDMDPLTQDFAIESRVDGGGWTLALTPRDRSFAEIIARLHATGGRSIRELQILEGRGDRTQIEFSNLETASCRLDEAEKARLAQ